MALFESNKSRERRVKRDIRKSKRAAARKVGEFKKAEEAHIRTALEAKKTGDAVILNKAKQALKSSRAQRILAERARMNMQLVEHRIDQAILTKEMASAVANYGKLVALLLKGMGGIDKAVENLSVGMDRVGEATDALFDGLEDLGAEMGEFSLAEDEDLVSDEDIDNLISERAAHEERKAMAGVKDDELQSLLTDIKKEKEQS